MRDGANRIIGFALLASLVLHAALLALLPQYRELSALLPPEPEPLIARVERVARVAPPTPRPQPPVPEVRKPAPPRPKPVPREPEPVAVPAPVPVPAVPAPAPPAPMFEPQAAPEPAPAPAPAAPAPLVRVDPRLLLEAPPAPDAARIRALARYGDEMNRAAEQFKRYPRAAVDNNWSGEVAVVMSVNAQGGIADLRIASGTGYPLLDRLALEMFREAHAVVGIPAALRGRAFDIDLRAIYEIRN